MEETQIRFFFSFLEGWLEFLIVLHLTFFFQWTISTFHSSLIEILCKLGVDLG